MTRFKSAASLLRTSIFTGNDSVDEKSDSEKQASSLAAEPFFGEKPPVEDPVVPQERSISHSSAEKTYSISSNPVILHNQDAHRLIRTIPTWAHSLDEDNLEGDPPLRIAPLSPAGVQIAHHNTNPTPKHKHDPPRGRLHDSQREWTPPLPGAPLSEYASRWKDFAHSSTYAPMFFDDGELVTEDWLVENGPDYSRRWLATSDSGDPENDVARHYRFRAKRKVWWKRLQRKILRSPIIPLIFRTIVWSFSLVALALGSSIHKLANTVDNGDEINSLSPFIAITVDAIALLYLLYITYDEYSGKPLGLRSPRAKIRLIFLDLFFIVFDSANLSLAFEAVTDSNPLCREGRLGKKICHQQKALASVLLVALIAWLSTFAVSISRLVERVAGG